MVYTIPQASLYLSTYIQEQKNLIDGYFQFLLNSAITDSDKKVYSKLYEDMIKALDNYEDNLRINFNKRLVKIITMPDNTDKDIFEIETLIHNNTIILYLTTSHKLIRINKYVKPSDIINYKEGNDIHSYSNLLAFVANNLIEPPYTSPSISDIDLNVTYLYLEDLRIYDYNHINKFIQLEVLELNLHNVDCDDSYNRIIGELTLPNLTSLCIKEVNNISLIKNLPLLETLSITESDVIFSIELLPSNLKEITFYQCEIPNFNFPLPETLEFLELSYNEIRNISISAPNLLKLEASYNIITTIELIGLKKLISLDLSSNKLTSITLGTEIDQIPVKFMEKIDLSYNELSEVKFLDSLGITSLIDKPKTQCIYLRENKLESFNHMFDHMPYITTLDMSHNNLTNDMLMPAFPNSLLITKLNMTHNNIRNLQDNPFYNLKNLNTLIIKPSLFDDKNHYEDYDVEDPMNNDYDDGDNVKNADDSDDGDNVKSDNGNDSDNDN